MIQYAISDLAGMVLGFTSSDAMPDIEAGRIAHVMVEPVPSFPKADTPTKVLYIANGALEWVETATLAALQAAAIAKTYADVDAIYADAIGNRATEYKEAADDSRAFAAAGFTGDVSEYVSSYALHNPTGIAQTNQWAAEQIIARADAFQWAQKTMRTTRFARQGEMQAATTAAELATAVAAWDGFIAGLRAQLGL